MDLNQLEAVLNPDGSVSILDPSSMETVYTIPAPIAYDANGAYAAQESLHFILTQTGNHTYSLTVVADPTWINAPERAFPVVIDPAIYANRTTITDTYVDEGVPTRTNGTNDFVATGHGSGGEEYVECMARGSGGRTFCRQCGNGNPKADADSGIHLLEFRPECGPCRSGGILDESSWKAAFQK